MKSIIVATDFSAPAENAMLYAGSLASRINASITLLHVYQIPVSMAEVPVMMISAEELKWSADEGLKKAKEILHNAWPEIEINIESRLGDVTDEISDLCKSTETFAIVSGRHGASGIERFFFGSTSLSIVRHAEVPVIVVPDNEISKEIKNVALAIDDLKEQLPRKRIRDFVNAFGAQLHVIHVQGSKTASKEMDGLVEGLDTKCITIRDDEFFHGIQNYIDQHSIDMLIIIPHHHSLVERLTFKTHTEELLKKLKIPVVCMNES